MSAQWRRLESLKGSLVQPSAIMQFVLDESTKGDCRVERGEKFPYVSIRTGSSWRNVSKERAGLGQAGPLLETGMYQMKGRKGSGGIAWPFGSFGS